MKQSLFIIIIFVGLFSCTKDDVEALAKNQNLSIHTPAWIQGTWMPKNATLNSLGLKFTSNDFLKIDGGNIESSVVDSYKQMQSFGTIVTKEEFSTPEEYTLEFFYKGDVIGIGGETYTFFKISASELNWKNIIYTKTN